MPQPDPTPAETAELRERVIQYARRAKQQGEPLELFHFIGGPLDALDVKLRAIGRRTGHEDEAVVAFSLPRPGGVVQVAYQAEGPVWRYRGTESPTDAMGLGKR